EPAGVLHRAHALARAEGRAAHPRQGQARPQARAPDGGGRHDRPALRGRAVVGRRRPRPLRPGGGGDGGPGQRDGGGGTAPGLRRLAQGSRRAVSAKKSYPMRINADVLAAAQRWADDELRSLNAQIEYVLRESLRKAGRLPKKDAPTTGRKENP